METKHTPGPWSVCLDIGVDGNINVFAPDEMGKAIALIDVREHPDDEDQASREEALANAQAIAALPDLLEACQKFVDSFKSLQREKCDVAHRMAVAAIAKAEGR